MKKKNIENTVAILGAGPSGLVAAKYALEQGLEPLILEKNSEIGGVWNPSTGFTWNTMSTNLSKYTCSFSDLPWEKESPMFPSSSDMFNYLNKYASNFGVAPYINFNSKVLDVSYNQESSDYRISWEHEGNINQQNVQYVIVATGIFAKPNIPNIEGIESFNGNIIHSSDYKDGEKFKDQKVLVIGGSLTGVEMSSDLSKYTKVTHSFREPFWALERYIPSSLTSKDKLPMDLVFYNRKFYETGLPPVQERYGKKNAYMEKLCQAQQKIPELKISEDKFNYPLKIAISDNYVSQVQNGALKPKNGNIIKFEQNSVIFSDESKESYDSILLATGFKTNLDYLSSDIQKKLQYNENDQIQPIVLYKETVHPEIPNMFFIGMYKGPYFSVMEHQAKWASKVFSGKISLPTLEEMQKGIQEEHDIRDMNPRMQFPHPDYVKFADDIARLSGENLDLDYLKKQDKSLYEGFLCMSVITGHFSIDNAKEQIMEVQNIIEDSRVVGDVSDIFS